MVLNPEANLKVSEKLAKEIGFKSLEKTLTQSPEDIPLGILQGLPLLQGDACCQLVLQMCNNVRSLFF